MYNNISVINNNRVHCFNILIGRGDIMDKYKIYLHNDLGEHGLYELRMFDGDRWSSAIWGPTLDEVRLRAYKMHVADTLEGILPNIPITEGSAELVWTGRTLKGVE